MRTADPGQTKRIMLRYCAIIIYVMLALWSSRAAAAPGGGRAWPCRIRDGANRELLFMTLGEVQTPVAQGVFLPDQDQVRLTDGTVLDHYYRDNLHIAYYRPIDKSSFPVPPSGWCSWYFYFYEISAAEVRQNAQWLADNLKAYGLDYVQIDDGWEGLGRGYNNNRDWTTINNRFPDGMQSLAADIRKLGLKPALWIAPHGQSNVQVIKAHPNAFLLKPDGTSLSDTWEGNYLVDPSTDEGQAYLKDLFTTLTRWGYDYFKIDGQPCVVDEYKRLAGQMKNPSQQPVELYRKTLRTIHEVIGSRRYLLGCWEIPLEGVGLTDGWRTGADVVPGWTGFSIALDATMGFYFLHNVVWYGDADNVMVHAPLTIEQARAWATLQGLTGQALMASDRMMDLSDERVELYRRIYPAVDIRPLDLFPSALHKPVWDLKVNHLGRRYDVVGLFNYDEQRNRPMRLDWNELGLATNQPVHVYDFWNKEYLGVYPNGYSTVVGPTSCKVLTLLPATADIQLISTSRHMTQGWLDLLSLQHDVAANTFKGRSRMIQNDPYELRFVYPPGKNFTITRATAGKWPVKISNHQGWATVEVRPGATTEMAWTVTFAPAPWYNFPCSHPGAIEAELSGLERVTLHWDQPGTSSIGSFRVSLDGICQGGTRERVFPLRNLAYGKSYAVQVTSVWDDGVISTNPVGTLTFSLDGLTRPEYALSELEPLRPAVNNRLERVGLNVSADGKPLAIGGRKYVAGLGVKAGVPVEFDLHGLFDEFTAMVGLDDGGRDGGVILIVEGDGRELWRSGEVRKAGGVQPVTIEVHGVGKLMLRATAAGPKDSDQFVDWCDARVRRR